MIDFANNHMCLRESIETIVDRFIYDVADILCKESAGLATCSPNSVATIDPMKATPPNSML